MKKLLALLLLPCSVLTAGKLAAQARYDEATHVFRLDSKTVTYAFGVNEQRILQPVYWGALLPAADPIPAAHTQPEIASVDIPTAVTPGEYLGFGGALYNEPALKITFADGVRDLVLHYQSHTLGNNIVDIVSKDIERDVFVTLHYRIDPETGIVSRSATIENRTKQPLTITQAAAASWTLPPNDHYQLSYLTGRWAGETSLQQESIHPGETVLESRRGSTSQQINPWFAVQRLPAAEESGPTWFGALAWSGSWRITVEQDIRRNLRITGGYNPFDFSYPLKPGERLDSPVFHAGFSPDGMGGASRLLHRFEISTVLPHIQGQSAPKLRPVLYNSWEATEFRINESGQMALAEKAARIGIERFVMDDGWFGQRKTDNAGLGDWYVNKTKFPNGLKPLIDKVHSLHMDFGLWVEPEMVNPDSDLYRAHPDWVLNFPGRPRTQARQQLVLNLAREDVRQYVLGFLDKLLDENDIAFLKWDYNRNWSEPGWPAVPPDQQQKVYVEYTRNLYRILADLRKKHPAVEIESCSSGGGRVDLGILALTDQVWTSDNTDPFDRLTIQDGLTHAYTPAVMMAWVTDSPGWTKTRTTSLQYGFLSSMQGSLGVGANLDKLQPEDFTTAAAMIGAYKQVRETVQRGALYRLISPPPPEPFANRGTVSTLNTDAAHSATEYVSPDRKEAVVFAFTHSSQENYPYPTLHLQGLDPSAQYTLSPLVAPSSASGTTSTMTPASTTNGLPLSGTPTAASGQWWMQHGIDIQLRGDFQATALRLVSMP